MYQKKMKMKIKKTKKEEEKEKRERNADNLITQKRYFQTNKYILATSQGHSGQKQN